MRPRTAGINDHEARRQHAHTACLSVFSGAVKCFVAALISLISQITFLDENQELESIVARSGERETALITTHFFSPRLDPTTFADIDALWNVLK
jgi:hypothetical protein